MALDKPQLKSDLQGLSTSPGATRAACAQKWADAMEDYAGGLVPASSSVAAAAATLKTALQSAFGLSSAVAAMDSAFATFATTVAAGQSPAFTGTPPPTPVGFADLFAEPYEATASAAATKISNRVHIWMKTGIATPSGPGSPVLWS